MTTGRYAHKLATMHGRRTILLALTLALTGSLFAASALTFGGQDGTTDTTTTAQKASECPPPLHLTMNPTASA